MMSIGSVVPNKNLFEVIDKLNMSVIPTTPKNDPNVSVEFSALGNRMYDDLLESEERLELKYRELIRKLSGRENSGEQRMRIKEDLAFIRRLKKRVKVLITIVNATNQINKLHFKKLMSDICISIKN